LLNIDRVRIVPNDFTPVRRTTLERGDKPKTFRYKLEYNVNRPGVSRLFVEITYNAVLPPAPTKLLELKAGDHSPANPSFREFDVSIPTNTEVKSLTVSFFLEPDLKASLRGRHDSSEQSGRHHEWRAKPCGSHIHTDAPCRPVQRRSRHVQAVAD